MAKTITLNFDDKEYVLEFNRETIMTLERQGFNINEFGNKPITNVFTLFQGAFKKNHASVPSNKILTMFKYIDNVEGLGRELAEMYSEALDSLEDGDDSKKVKWEKSW